MAPASKPSNRNKLLAAAAAAALLLVVVLVAISLAGGGDGGSSAGSGGELAGGPEAAATFRGIPQDGLTLGRAGAPVTLVEFLDPQCPVCARFSQEHLRAIVDRYVRPGRVRLEMRILRFLGDDSIEAAVAFAAASEQNRAWPFADVFFANQGGENTGYVDEEFLRQIGGAVAGMDVDRLVEDSRSEAAEDVAAESQLEAEDNGVASTPSFLVGPTGGRLEPLGFEGLLPLERYTARLDAALRQAR